MARTATQKSIIQKKTMKIHMAVMAISAHHRKLDNNCHQLGEVQNLLQMWCKCGKCRIMSKEIEIMCCKTRKCVTENSRFQKVCLDAHVLELCIKNRADIKNDREDNSTRTF